MHLMRDNLARLGWPSRARTVVGQAPLDGLATFYITETTRLERIKILV